jgi:hypothetical protein
MSAKFVLGVCGLAALLSSSAYADDDTQAQAQNPQDQAESVQTDEMPPTPPRPPSPDEDADQYAGVGSTSAYSEAGVVELGGSLSFSGGNQSTSVAADPFIGYFLWDNLQASLIVGTRWNNNNGANSTRFSVVLEPSFHYPFSRYVFGFAGVGVGMASANPAIDDTTFGTAIAPRAGVQFLVGRSGLINVGVRQVLTFVDANDAIDPYQGRTVLAFTNSFDGQVGYTVMF